MAELETVGIRTKFSVYDALLVALLNILKGEVDPIIPPHGQLNEIPIGDLVDLTARVMEPGSNYVEHIWKVLLHEFTYI